MLRPPTVVALTTDKLNWVWKNTPGHPGSSSLVVCRWSWMCQEQHSTTKNCFVALFSQIHFLQHINQLAFWFFSLQLVLCFCMVSFQISFMFYVCCHLMSQIILNCKSILDNLYINRNWNYDFRISSAVCKSSSVFCSLFPWYCLRDLWVRIRDAHSAGSLGHWLKFPPAMTSLFSVLPAMACLRMLNMK